MNKMQTSFAAPNEIPKQTLRSNPSECDMTVSTNTPNGNQRETASTSRSKMPGFDTLRGSRGSPKKKWDDSDSDEFTEPGNRSQPQTPIASLQNSPALGRTGDEDRNELDHWMDQKQ